MAIPPQTTAATAARERPARTHWRVGAGLGVLCVIGVGALIASRASAPSPVARDTAAVPEAAASPERRDAQAPGSEPATAYAVVDAKRAGAAAYRLGDLSGALTELESAVTAAPDDAEARNNLAQVLIRHGRVKDALLHLDEAVRFNAAQWSYRFNRARAYGLLDRWPDAVNEYRVALQLFPEDHVTAYNLGLAQMRTKEYVQAAATLEQAVSLSAESHDFLVTLGTAYVGAEKPDRARATFEKFLAAAPSNPDAPRVKALLEAMAAAGQ